jgi:hypothetical protein
MGKRPSDQRLRRWLSTGRPRRVGRLLETDSGIGARLDELSRLEPAQVAALAEVSAPARGFPDRTVLVVQERIDTYATVALVADLLGLGWQTGRVVLGDPEVGPEWERRESPEP